MNNFYDMRNYLLHIYIEAYNNFPKELYNKSEEEKEEIELNRLNYIIDKIYNELDDTESFLSLLVLYFYLLESPDNDILCSKDSYGNPLISLIEQEEYNVILECLNPENSSFIYEILSYIIDNDLFNYDLDYYEKNDIEDYNEYKIFSDVIDTEKFKIVKKLHPDLDSEDIRYSKYVSDEQLLVKISDMKIKSLGLFTQVFMVLKNEFTYKCYLSYFTRNVLDDLELNNHDLYKELSLYILKYCYVEEYIHNKEYFNDIKEYILENLNNLNNLDNCFIDEFSTFDLTHYMIDYSKLSKEEKEIINSSISVDKLNTYGIEGNWIKYNKSNKELISSYFPMLDLNNNTDKIIYYSIDKDGNYTIPRICLEILNNNIVNVLGKDYNGNIEFELINILSNKIEEFDNYNYIQSELVILDNLYEIELKLNKKMELTNDEIDLLYGINYNLDEILFSNYLYKIELLKDKSNIKKDLSKYFNCSIDEVACDQFEINEKTVVTTFFFPMEEKCYYPNLKVIFCDAWGDFLLTAEGLPSLEYIKGDALFGKLQSSYGLSNLVRIDGDAVFNSLEDTSYFNKDLIIKGNEGFDKGYTLIK